MQRLLFGERIKTTCLDHRTFLCSLQNTFNLASFMTLGGINCVFVLIPPWHDKFVFLSFFPLRTCSMQGYILYLKEGRP